MGNSTQPAPFLGSTSAPFPHDVQKVRSVPPPRAPDGEKVDIWTRSTVIFRKEGSTWKVMHVHSSVPFYMDGSFKAAVDLKP